MPKPIILLLRPYFKFYFSENHLVINTVNDNIQGNNTELNEFSYSNDGEEQNKTDFGEENCDLASFLIDRASKNTTLANYFYW